MVVFCRTWNFLNMDVVVAKTDSWLVISVPTGSAIVLKVTVRSSLQMLSSAIKLEEQIHFEYYFENTNPWR